MSPLVLIYSPEANVAAALSAAVRRLKWDPDEHRVEVTTVNLSEGGMCIHGEIKGWNREHVVQFRNPRLNSEFRANSSIIWSDSGRTGVRFQVMSTAAKVLLNDCLRQYE